MKLRFGLLQICHGGRFAGFEGVSIGAAAGQRVAFVESYPPSMPQYRRKHPYRATPVDSPYATGMATITHMISGIVRLMTAGFRAPSLTSWAAGNETACRIMAATTVSASSRPADDGRFARHSDNIASIIHVELSSMAIAKAAVAIKNIIHAKRADFHFMAKNSLSNHPFDNQHRAILTGSSRICVAAMAESVIEYLKSFSSTLDRHFKHCGIDQNDVLPRGTERRALLNPESHWPIDEC